MGLQPSEKCEGEGQEEVEEGDADDAGGTQGGGGWVEGLAQAPHAPHQAGLHQRSHAVLEVR